MLGFPSHFDHDDEEGEPILDLPITSEFVTRMRVIIYYLSLERGKLPNALRGHIVYLGEWMKELDEQIKQAQMDAAEGIESVPPDYSEPPY